MTSLENDFSPEGNSSHFEHDIVTASFTTIWLGNQNAVLTLPPANLSISVRTRGSLWISCITSLVVAERLKLLSAPRLHQESCNEEVTGSLQEVLFLQRPFWYRRSFKTAQTRSPSTTLRFSTQCRKSICAVNPNKSRVKKCVFDYQKMMSEVFILNLVN